MPSRELVLAVISSSSSLSSPAQSRWFRPQSGHQSWTWRHSTGRSQSSPPTCLHPCQSPLWWPSSTPAPIKEQLSLAASSCTSATSPPTIFPACRGSSKCSWSPCPWFWSSQSFPFTPPAPGLSNHWSLCQQQPLPICYQRTLKQQFLPSVLDKYTTGQLQTLGRFLSFSAWELSTFWSEFSHNYRISSCRQKPKPIVTPTHTYACLTTLFRDYSGEPVPER